MAGQAPVPTNSITVLAGMKNTTCNKYLVVSFHVVLDTISVVKRPALS